MSEVISFLTREVNAEWPGEQNIKYVARSE